MNVGTKSVLYGAHAFWLHPWFVAAAWWKLYGFPWDPRLWVAFFVHDLGYWGKPNMDGPEGEEHPRWGALVMTALFDASIRRGGMRGQESRGKHGSPWLGPWGSFVYYHSRFLAKRYGRRPSRLCSADKLAVALEPWWLYLPRVIASGEIREYMSLAEVREGAKYGTMGLNVGSRRAWYESMQTYLRAWVEEHKDGRADTWTPDQREARDANGVWS